MGFISKIFSYKNSSLYYQICLLFILISPLVHSQCYSIYSNASEQLKCIYFLNELKGWVGTDRIDGSILASGIYYFQMNAGDFTASRKLIFKIERVEL